VPILRLRGRELGNCSAPQMSLAQRMLNNILTLDNINGGESSSSLADIIELKVATDFDMGTQQVFSLIYPYQD